MGDQVHKLNEGIRNVFLKDKYKIDFRLMTKKQITIFKWNQLIKGLTHLFYLTLISTIFGLGWKYVIEANQVDMWQNIQQKTVMIGYGIGHGFTQLAQVFFGYRGKIRIDKKILDENGNPLLKKSWTNKLFLIISLIPFIVWLIGYILIKIHYKETKQKEIKKDGN